MILNWFQKNSVSTEELRKVIDRSEVIVIDVREPYEYKSGHIEKAKNIPLSKLSQQLKKIPKDKDIYLICQSGMRSQKAYSTLKENGYTQIKNVQGGMSSWRGSVIR